MKKRIDNAHRSAALGRVVHPATAPAVRRLDAVTQAQVRSLAELLVDAVEGGASVSFMQPLSLAKASAFWQGVADGVQRNERALLVAEDASGIVGTVQLVLNQPENQPHRADLSKMLVASRARCRGIGALLMQAAEQTALACGKTLLVLDTASAQAERLYQRHGWQRCGAIPGYALLPHGGLCDTVYYWRWLTPQPPRQPSPSLPDRPSSPPAA